jgi:large subunit ribosomal protein L23
MTNITADQGKYGFLVNTKSNKIEIAKAIEKKFNVHVINVRTINHMGKTKTQFRKSGRFVGKTPSLKKAIVTLKKGETIELFEQV